MAHFFNEKGGYIGKKFLGFSIRNKRTFKYLDSAYNIDMEKCSEVSKTIIPFIIKRREMFYNIAFSNPYTLDKDKNVQPPISPHNYKTQLETKLLDDLNNLAKSKFKLDIKMVLIALGVIAFIILYATGKIKI